MLSASGETEWRLRDSSTPAHSTTNSSSSSSSPTCSHHLTRYSAHTTDKRTVIIRATTLWDPCDAPPRAFYPTCGGEAFPSLFLVLLPPLPFLLEVGALNSARRSGAAHLSAILSIEIASGGNKTVLSVYLFGQSFATTGQEMSSKVVVSGVGDFLPLAHL